MISRNLLIGAGIAALILAWPSSGLADIGTYRLAYSQKLAAEVFAVRDSNGSWCAPSVNLEVSLNDSSALLSPSAQANRDAFAAKLGNVLTRECPAAVRATIQFVKVSGANTIDSETIALGASGWTKAAAAPLPLAPSSGTPASPVRGSVIPPEHEPAPAPLAIGEDYQGMLVKFLRDNPDLANSDAASRWWAEIRFFREYMPLQNQEFALQPLLARAKADLNQAIARSDPDRVLIHVQTQFQTYDFSSQRFPVNLNGDQFTLTPRYCCAPGNLPRGFTVSVSGLDEISGFPMDRAAAQSFEQRRTFYSSVNRTVWIGVIVKLESGQLSSESPYYIPVTGSIAGATFYGNSDYTEELYTLDESELARRAAIAAATKAAEEAKLAEEQQEAAAAEKAREAEARRQQIIAERESYVQMLESASASTRLANFILPGPIDTTDHLISLRAARAEALITGHPADVVMLVQAYSSGTEKVATRWPGHLTVTVPDDQSLQSSKWYIVHGTLTVPPGDDLPDANLAAAAVYACQKDQCADAMDPSAIVSRKLAAAGGN